MAMLMRATTPMCRRTTVFVVQRRGFAGHGHGPPVAAAGDFVPLAPKAPSNVAFYGESLCKSTILYLKHNAAASSCRAWLARARLAPGFAALGNPCSAGHGGCWPGVSFMRRLRRPGRPGGVRFVPVP